MFRAMDAIRSCRCLGDTCLDFDDLEKSYGTPSDSSGLSGKKFNTSKIRRQKENIDSESVDDLFSRQVGSEFDGESGSIELNSVMVQ
jgi:hypothetical protein